MLNFQFGCEIPSFPNYFRLNIIALLFLFAVSSCKQKEDTKISEKQAQDYRFQILPPDSTGISFNNKLEETMEFNPVNSIYMYNGAGVGVGDINNDGLPDLFFAGNNVSSQLYLNKGDLKFENITESAGVTTSRWATGVSMVDINNDGYLDIYVSVADKNYTEKGANLLFINQGDNTFVEKAKEFGIADTGYSTQGEFFDYDKDGDLDLYVLTNGIENFTHNSIRKRKLKGNGISTDKLYRNDGDKGFTNVSEEAGITIEGYGLGIGIMDVNNDGWPDIYCSNDFITNDLLWVNNGDGTFTESLATYFTQTSHNGMGIDIADFNNDGLLDLVEMDMLPEDNEHNKKMTPAANYNNQLMRFQLDYFPQYVRNSLQVRTGQGSFAEVGRLAGIEKTDWSWAPLMADFDNDGLKDLFITNGYGRDITDLDYTVNTNITSAAPGDNKNREKQAFELMSDLPEIKLPNYFYKNEGGLIFSDATKIWNNEPASISNGAIYSDLDNDGDLDLVTNNTNGVAFLYQNLTSDKFPDNANYIKIELSGPEKNKNGIGSKISIFTKDQFQRLEQFPVRGYISSVDYVLHAGLGKTKTIDSISIEWPDGKVDFKTKVAANQKISFDYKNALEYSENSLKAEATFFTETTVDLKGIQHKEDLFVDYRGEPLLLKMLSREGPAIAVSDVDGDGLDDFLMTSAIADSTYIYYQNRNGSFKKSKALPSSFNTENLGALIADFNGDGKKDIYIATGGNNKFLGQEVYRDLLYFQTENGDFELAENQPPVLTSTAAVTAADYDNDGDLDLFVGTRIKPNTYPLSERSYILQNTNGIFTDVTQKVAPFLLQSGMITSALWTDFDNDQKMDLIVTGEWMEINFLKNTGGKFENITATSGMQKITGFWNSLQGMDVDRDGDIDYLAGNMGRNVSFDVSAQEPLTMMAKDFDDNGQIDPLIGYYLNGKSYPLATRDALINQIPNMKKRFYLYKDYAKAEFKDVLTPEEKKGALKLNVTELSSGWIENQGKGKFKFHAFPVCTQVAPVYGITTLDVNGDDILDVVLAGNRRDSEVLGGFMDGSFGVTLIGDGAGRFNCADMIKSGISIPGDARGIAKIKIGNKLNILAANNDGRMQKFSLEKEEDYIEIFDDENYAIITTSEKSYKVEFYYGSGYLTQDFRKMILPQEFISIEIYNTKNQSRIINHENSGLVDNRD
ncbi:VCBS repeat-containing protein [Gramella sp. AN32]|uniref:VCBS repeat-containing protein n=1 Tax=Christiangramia antarctica TaxID=2058158 RepID=A0ABW5X586_9FLAO|nr:VCBS repeat-containing protein [Gramella sp. AN32]MCM4157855.1 RNA-binding protein [Gramella sp. AN32]